MFGSKKHIDTQKINTFNDAVRAIKAYIYLSEWSKARRAINDIKQKEEVAYRDLEEKIKDNFKLISPQKKIYEKNFKIIENLERNYEIKKIKYERHIE
jgi:hypothetical protein